MRPHGCIAVADVRGQNNGHRRLGALLGALAFKSQTHGAVVRHIPQ